MADVFLLSNTFNIKKVLYKVISIYRKINIKNDNELSRLIRLLIKNNETSFLEHINVTFEINNITLIGLSHITRHRIASYSVESQRYTERRNKYKINTPNMNKYSNKDALKLIDDHIKSGYELYRKLINKFKWSKSYARMVVSPSDCRDMICTFNFRSLRNFFNLRLSNKAQVEIRQIANKMLTICKQLNEDCFFDF